MRIDSAALALVAAITIPTPASGHGETQHAPKNKSEFKAEQKAFGIAGDRRRASRTITVDMSDQMRFRPSTLDIKRGETVRFVVRNRGKVMHEMVLGTIDELREHASLMRKFPEMEHDEPYMAHVQPGKSEDIVWTFNRTGEFNYGCLVPGHFEAGMIGKVTVR